MLSLAGCSFVRFVGWLRTVGSGSGSSPPNVRCRIRINLHLIPTHKASEQSGSGGRKRCVCVWKPERERTSTNYSPSQPFQLENFLVGGGSHKHTAKAIANFKAAMKAAVFVDFPLQARAQSFTFRCDFPALRERYSLPRARTKRGLGMGL